MSKQLTEPAKLLLLTTLLAKDRIISNNGKCFLKELILRRDARLGPLLRMFESGHDSTSPFLEEIHKLISEEARNLYEDLFEDTSIEVGKLISKEERERKNLQGEKSLIYGEVDFASFYRVLRKINPEPGLIFYDLGSGTGKALLAARITQDFSKCIGIEILSGLHKQASKIVDRYNNDFRALLALGQAQHVAVYEGSFLSFDWSDGDIVFANSTCYDDNLMEELSAQSESLKPGAIVVTFTKGMTSSKFELLEKKRYRMSWGPATVFIHRRLLPDGKPVGPSKLNILPSDSIPYEDEEHAASADYQRFMDEKDDSESGEDMNAIDEDEEEDQEGSEGEEESADEEAEEEVNGNHRNGVSDSDEEGGWTIEQFIKKYAPSRTQSGSAQDGSNAPKPGANQTPTKKPPQNGTVDGTPQNSGSKGSSSSLSIPAPTGSEDGSDFHAMTSPQDSALLMRKRSGRKTD